ncbi:MAG: GMC family oxidoreductase [Pyrinomonadaceae bacterium]
MAHKQYDVLIIGSGASGGMAAYTLTQKGLKCLMLDAGPAIDFERQVGPKPIYELPYRGFGKPGKLKHVLQAHEFNANLWVDEQQAPYTYNPNEPFNWVRVRAIGGKTLQWGRVCLRFSDHQFKARDHDGFGDNWPINYADLAPYYDKVEPIFRVFGRRDGLAQIPDGIFIENNSLDSEGSKRFIAAARSRGGFSTKLRQALGSNRLASSLNLLLPVARATRNLTIVPNAVVRGITVNKATGLADGVNFVDRVTGRELSAKARVVVVGASCLESTRLLLNSGLANSSGVLGHYLHDHFYLQPAVMAIVPEARNGKGAPGPGLFGAGGNIIPPFTDSIARKKNYLRGYSIVFGTVSNLDVKYFPSWGEELQRDLDSSRGAGFRADVQGEVLSRYESEVRIDSKVVDAWGVPVLNIRTRYTENEFSMAKDAVETIGELCREAGFEVLNRTDQMFPPGYSIHELGTCRMGEDPKTSVLNKWNQSHDIKNLFVVDGSSFVSGGSQNPTLTIMALAMRSSDYLAEQMRKGNL